MSRYSWAASIVVVVVLMVLCTQQCTGHFSNDTEIERIMETEIIFREPRSYSHLTKEYMVTRQDYAEKFKQYSPDGKLLSERWLSKEEMWGHMAYRYWFETRKPYIACDMEPSSFSTHFDWACLVPCMYGDPFKLPSTVYVNTFILPHFVESTLKAIDPKARFVLISAGDDLTIPRSIDNRYPLLRGFSRDSDGGDYYQRLLKDPRIIHWYIENHDMVHPKISTLPTGLTNDIHDQVVANMPTTTHYFADRTFQILVSDRAREGTGQWATRGKVIKLCDSLPRYCLRPPKMTELGISHDKYIKLLRSVPFVACAHGGGIDPSPKAWEAIMVGTIPIIEHSTLDDAYSQLPVAFVNSWEELLKPESEEKLVSTLRRWMEELQPYYVVGSALRNETLQKLRAQHWVDQIEQHVKNYHLAGGKVLPVNNVKNTASDWVVVSSASNASDSSGIDGNISISGSGSASASASTRTDESESSSGSASGKDDIATTGTTHRPIRSATSYTATYNTNTVRRSSTTEILRKPVRPHYAQNGP